MSSIIDTRVESRAWEDNLALGAERVVVIGAGMGGLVAALELAALGMEVTVIERAGTPGGKLRQSEIGQSRLDAGPTVFTMRWVFEEIFSAVNASLDAYLRLQPVDVLARHAWGPDQRLDLFSDVDRSADAIGVFAGAAEARRYRAFCARAQNIYETLEGPFIRAARPGVFGLVRGVGVRGLGDLWRIKPFTTMWRALGEYFEDPRLRQLFGRYATYCGSSPFSAPATLILVAHVEREGVWLVEGGMYRIAEALAALGADLGVTFRYGADVDEVIVDGGKAAGVRLASGERIAADAVVVNADAGALSTGRLGSAVTRAIPPIPRSARSLSAVTWAFVGEADGFPLARHSVFFSDNYSAEFDDIFKRNRLPERPTVYVCAQDRTEGNEPSANGAERIFCLVNAPPRGDGEPFDASEIEQCQSRTFHLLERCGLHLRPPPESTVVTTPTDFDRLFPTTGGALYGRASHGWMASFQRPGSRSRVPRLYLAGGSVHPGPGLAMAALSGRQAAASLLSDLASTSRFRPVAMSGGTSTA